MFLFHWKEESQHAILDELEWRREDARLTEAERDQAVTDLIELVAAVDGVVQAQAQADAGYFLQRSRPHVHAGRGRRHPRRAAQAYRWQYIVSGVQEPRFGEVLAELVTPAQMERIGAALGPIVAHVAYAAH